MLCRNLPALLGFTFLTATAVGQTADAPKALPPATDAQLEALAESEAYEYSIVIREKKNGTYEEVGAPKIISQKGSEAFAGLPHGDGKSVDPSLPSRVYCKVKVEDCQDGVAKASITVGQSFDVKQDHADTSWTEQKRCVRRNVRLGDSVTVQLAEAILPISSPFEFRVVIDRYVPKQSAR
jgi:hypothetical protein